MQRQQREERAVQAGNYIKRHKATVRETATVLGISKSTVHKDVTDVLLMVKPKLYKEVREVLDYNNSVKHIRGGNVTSDKWKHIKEQCN